MRHFWRRQMKWFLCSVTLIIAAGLTIAFIVSPQFIDVEGYKHFSNSLFSVDPTHIPSQRPSIIPSPVPLDISIPQSIPLPPSISDFAEPPTISSFTVHDPISISFLYVVQSNSISFQETPDKYIHTTVSIIDDNIYSLLAAVGFSVKEVISNPDPRPLSGMFPTSKKTFSFSTCFFISDHLSQTLFLNFIKYYPTI